MFLSACTFAEQKRKGMVVGEREDRKEGEQEFASPLDQGDTV